MGKTRIATELTTEVLAEYPDRVWLVGMAALSDPADVPREVAPTLGSGAIRPVPGRHPGGGRRQPPAATRPKRLRAPARCCARLADALLTACPELRVLVTSHEPLRVLAPLLALAFRPLPGPAPLDARGPDADRHHGARESSLGYERIRGEVLKLGIVVSARSILRHLPVSLSTTGANASMSSSPTIR